MTVLDGVVAEADVNVEVKAVLSRVLEANERWERLAEQLREENAALREENQRLRERGEQRQGEFERVSADLAVLQRLVFGRSSERARAGTGGDGAGGDGAGGDGAGVDGRTGGGGKRGGAGKRGPGGRAGRRDYSHLPRIEVVWDFDGVAGVVRAAAGQPKALTIMWSSRSTGR